MIDLSAATPYYPKLSRRGGTSAILHLQLTTAYSDALTPRAHDGCIMGRHTRLHGDKLSDQGDGGESGGSSESKKLVTKAKDTTTKKTWQKIRSQTQHLRKSQRARPGSAAALEKLESSRRGRLYSVECVVLPLFAVALFPVFISRFYSRITSGCDG